MNLVNIHQKVDTLLRAMDDYPVTLVCLILGLVGVVVIIVIAIDAIQRRRRWLQGKKAYEKYNQVR